LERKVLKKLIEQQSQSGAPRVSVAMVTYNHEKYITQAIESVLMQVTNFPVELVIGEDCSTDGTRTIVKHYAEKYPQFIRALLPERNLGAHNNYSAVMSGCNAEYIAYLEGDDYWTDPSKLSRQVAPMDSDLTMSFCFHPVTVFDQELGAEAGVFPAKDPRLFQDMVEELIRWNFIASNSRMLRRSMLPVFDSQFQDLKLGDWPVSIMMGIRGKIGYLPENMAVYRRHTDSTWSSKGQDVRDLATYEMFYYLYQKKLDLYNRSIAASALMFSRFVLDHGRSQGLRRNMPLVLTSLKISCRTDFPGIVVHAVWLFFYFILPERRGAWYDALSKAGRAVLDPPPGSFLCTVRATVAKLARLIPFANRPR
jgi:glycosyltransferase involved in cell wall biosynthesis